MRLSADEHEHRPRLQPTPLATEVVLDHDGLQRVVADQLADLTVREDVDRRRGLDAICEIPRHVLVQAPLANDEGQAWDVPGEQQYSLSGGVAAAHGHHRLSATLPRLDLCRLVVDADALEPVEIGQRQAAVAHAGGDHDRAATRISAIAQRNPEPAVEQLQTGGPPGD